MVNTKPKLITSETASNPWAPVFKTYTRNFNEDGKYKVQPAPLYRSVENLICELLCELLLLLLMYILLTSSAYLMHFCSRNEGAGPHCNHSPGPYYYLGTWVHTIVLMASHASLSHSKFECPTGICSHRHAQRNTAWCISVTYSDGAV